MSYIIIIKKSVTLKGIEKGVILTAKNALFKGLSIDDIIDTTGLTKKQIEKIAKELGKGN